MEKKRVVKTGEVILSFRGRESRTRVLSASYRSMVGGKIPENRFRKTIISFPCTDTEVREEWDLRRQQDF